MVQRKYLNITRITKKKGDRPLKLEIGKKIYEKNQAETKVSYQQKQ